MKMTTSLTHDSNEPNYDPIIKLPKVCEITGLSKSSIYDKMKEGTFPKSIAISSRSVGWLLSEVNAFIQARVAESRQEASE